MAQHFNAGVLKFLLTSNCTNFTFQIMKICIALFMASYAISVAQTNALNPPYLGIFESKDGYVSLMLDIDGKGLLSSVPILWKNSQTNDQIVITGPFGLGQKKESLSLGYNAEKREFFFLDKSPVAESGALQFVTNQIPKELESAIQTGAFLNQ